MTAITYKTHISWIIEMSYALLLLGALYSENQLHHWDTVLPTQSTFTLPSTLHVRQTNASKKQTNKKTKNTHKTTPKKNQKKNKSQPNNQQMKKKNILIFVEALSLLVDLYWLCIDEVLKMLSLLLLRLLLLSLPHFALWQCCTCCSIHFMNNLHYAHPLLFVCFVNLF